MNNGRALIIVFFAFAGFVALVVKLTGIQIVRHEEYTLAAMRQHDERFSIPPERGKILDRNGLVLAFTRSEYSASVNTIHMDEDDRRIVADSLSVYFGKDASYYRKLMDSRRGMVKMADNVPGELAIKLRKLRPYELMVEPEFERNYPNGKLASHLLGYINSKGLALTGVEQEYNEKLTGKPGLIMYERDGRGNPVSVREDISYPAVNGGNVYLTIDKSIQGILEEELSRGIAEFGGEWATGIIMDPNDGSIIALANYPDYSPEKYSDAPDSARRNRAVTDTYEPGSTIKSVVMSVLLQENLVEENEIIDTENGSFRYRRVNIYDTHAYQSLSVKGVLRESSNIGMVKLSERIDKNSFFKYMRDFGFGNPTSVDLPGESGGYLKKPKDFGNITKAFMAHGYELSTTPLQMITAFSAVVNGGVLYKPRIIARIGGLYGEEETRFGPEKIRRVIDGKISSRMKTFMQDVVENGTGSNAAIEGIPIGGKTGTAQVWTGKEYSNKKYNASFAGFFPVENPKYTMLIIYNAPEKGKYGGQVAAPVFRNIVARIVDLNPGIIPGEKKEKRNFETLIAEASQDKGNSMYMDPGEEKSEEEPAVKVAGEMPDLVNLSTRSALRLLNGTGVEVKIIGSGKVVSQSIVPGKKLEPGMECIIKCERTKGSIPD